MPKDTTQPTAALPRAPTTLYRIRHSGVTVTRSFTSWASLRPQPPEPLLLVAVSPDLSWCDFLDRLDALTDEIRNGRIEGPGDWLAVNGPMDAEAA